VGVKCHLGTTNESDTGLAVQSGTLRGVPLVRNNNDERYDKGPGYEAWSSGSGGEFK
jgi:hypothetical protein